MHNVNTTLSIVKRDGSSQLFNDTKIKKIINWACSGLLIDPDQVMSTFSPLVYNGVTSTGLQLSLERHIADQIAPHQPDYSIAAGRVLAFHLRKLAYGQFTPPSLTEHVKKLTRLGKYDTELNQSFSKDELDELNAYIRHDKELYTPYVSLKQFADKYLLRDRVTQQIYETPQMALMVISMTFFSSEDKAQRLNLIKEFYSELSENNVSLPTPIMAGVRTPTRQFSSCSLISTGDTLNGIFNAAHAQGQYAAMRAGVGVNVGRIRAEGSAIRGGEAKHAGLVGIIQLMQSALGWTSQGGIRKASSTLFYPVWHSDFEQLIVLKNNKGTEETRARHLDYGVQLSRLFYARLIEDKNITLFSPDVADGKLYDAFYADQDKFEELYVQLENDPSVKKKTLTAVEVFSQIATERASTGRIYIQNVDHCNTHSSFLDPVEQSNLCVAPETMILTKNGYKEIASLVGEMVTVWNGQEWSEVQVTKTGENKPVVTVTTSQGQELDCTEYHKFPVKRAYHSKHVMTPTKDLNVGDKLDKFNLPVIEGERVLESAYTDGLWSEQGYNGKVDFFVPDCTYTTESRIQWLDGWLDANNADFNGKTIFFVFDVNKLKSVQKVQLMLQELGVMCSLTKSEDKETYAFRVDARNIKKLHEMQQTVDSGTQVVSKPTGGYNRIVSIVDKGRTTDTYCFSEPKRHTGMFNGIMTGQCMEITLPTTPIEDYNTSTGGEIGLCTLAAINLGKRLTYPKMERCLYLLVRALDNLLDYQGYPVEAAKNALKRRSLGIGVINYAAALAQRGLKFSDGSANNYTHELFEEIQYACLKASMELAKERGQCEWFSRTKYSKGLLPIDTYKQAIDEYHTTELKLDWEGLRKDILQYGLRNSTLTALMPSETSSLISNATNGIEPVRQLMTVKSSGSSAVRQLVPEVEDLYADYELKFDMLNPRGYLTLVGIMQKFIDQAISANTPYDPNKFEGSKVKMEYIIKDMLLAYRLGVKTLYYYETNDEKEHLSDCDSCKI